MRSAGFRRRSVSHVVVCRWFRLPAADHQLDRVAAGLDLPCPWALGDDAARSPRASTADASDRAVPRSDPCLGCGEPEADHPRHDAAHRWWRRRWWRWWRWRRRWWRWRWWRWRWWWRRWWRWRRWRRRRWHSQDELLDSVERHGQAVAAAHGEQRVADRRPPGERSRVIEARLVRPRVRDRIEARDVVNPGERIARSRSTPSDRPELAERNR